MKTNPPKAYDVCRFLTDSAKRSVGEISMDQSESPMLPMHAPAPVQIAASAAIT